jgi:hypothetical protein
VFLEPLSSVSNHAKHVASSAPKLNAIYQIRKAIPTTGDRVFSFLHFFHKTPPIFANMAQLCLKPCEARRFSCAQIEAIFEIRKAIPTTGDCLVSFLHFFHKTPPIFANMTHILKKKCFWGLSAPSQAMRNASLLLRPN